MFGNLGSMFGGFDISKMLSGDGGGGGNMITNMIMKQLAKPETQQMITGKISEMFDFLAKSTESNKEQVSLLLKLENVPAKNEKGELILEPVEGGAAVQKLEQKAIVYVMVGNQAKQKISIDQFLAMMQEQGG